MVPKGLKTALIAFGITLGILAALFIAFQIWIHTYYFEITEASWGGSFSSVEELEEHERLASEGYVISYPHFHNMTSFNADNDRPVYSAINLHLSSYAAEIAEEYKSYAKLDYTVGVKPNETLTVAFTGTGYFYDDREPVPLGKTFVFDIKNISPEHLPTLIGEWKRE